MGNGLLMLLFVVLFVSECDRRSHLKARKGKGMGRGIRVVVVFICFLDLTLKVGDLAHPGLGWFYNRELNCHSCKLALQYCPCGFINMCQLIMLHNLHLVNMVYYYAVRVPHNKPIFVPTCHSREYIQ